VEAELARVRAKSWSASERLREQQSSADLRRKQATAARRAAELQLEQQRRRLQKCDAALVDARAKRDEESRELGQQPTQAQRSHPICAVAVPPVLTRVW
jgi:broad specificity phosphatase PhoE